jgi:alpha-ketoglutarate-dependent taurine dioxygenase
MDSAGDRPEVVTSAAGRAGWARETFSPSDWLVALPASAVGELDTIADVVRSAPAGPVEDLHPDRLALPECARVMARVRAKLRHEGGMAVVDRVPVERYSVAENRAIAWVLASMLGRVVAQKADGTRVYDVRDTGQALGYGVRRSVTNLEQAFHTDGGWLRLAPEFVGLFCLEPAREGGLSRAVSLVTAHDEMRRRCPDLLARLYRVFPWDRQAEHPPGEPRFAEHPVFAENDGRLTGRYYEDYVVNGYRLAGRKLDRVGGEALETLRALLDAPTSWVELRIQKGQFQYLNNRWLAHSRTAFRDPDATGPRRHLLRFWNRDEGTPDVEGAAAG